MINTETLSKLIRSLSASEKRFYQVQSQKLNAKGKNKYLLLFEIINTNRAVSEYQLMHKLKTKNVSRLRHYLYFDILNTLKNYETNDKKIEILRKLQVIRFLYYKNLHSQIKDLLEIALKEAFEMENWGIYIELLAIKRIFIALRYYPEQPHLRKQLYELEKKANQYLYEENELWYKSSSLLENIRKKGYTENAEEMRLLHESSKQYPLNLPEREIYSKLAKSYYHTFWSTYQHLLKNQDAVFFHVASIIELYKSWNISLITILSVYNNYLYFCKYYKNFNKQYYIYLDEIKCIKAETNILEGQKFTVYYANVFEEITLLNDWQRLPAIEKEFNETWEKLSAYTAFFHAAFPLYTYVHTLLHVERYDDCLEKINLIFEHEAEYNQDTIFTTLKLMEIICWLEKKEFTYLQSLLIQAKRYITQKEKWSKSNTIFYSVLKKHLHKSTFQQQVFYKELHDKLKAESENNPVYGDTGFFYFDLQNWSAYKITLNQT